VDSTPTVRAPEGTAWEMLESVRSLPPDFGSRDEAVERLIACDYPPGVAQWMAINLEPRGGRYRWRIDLDAMEEMLRDFFRTDLWPVIENPPPGVEIHVVKATESHTLDPESTARVEAAGRANGRVFLHLLEGGHWINTDNPDAVLRLLAERLP
jgi:esterase